jgi:hypothetical protein
MPRLRRLLFSPWFTGALLILLILLFLLVIRVAGAFGLWFMGHADTVGRQTAVCSAAARPLI